MAHKEAQACIGSVFRQASVDWACQTTEPGHTIWMSLRLAIITYMQLATRFRTTTSQKQLTILRMYKARQLQNVNRIDCMPCSNCHQMYMSHV